MSNGIKTEFGDDEELTVDYRRSFLEMLDDAGIDEVTKAKIFRKIGGQNGIVFAEADVIPVRFKDSRFTTNLAITSAINHLQEYLHYQCFGIEHLLAYVKKYPTRYRQSIAYALGQAYSVENVPHVFCVTMHRKHIDLDLVPVGKGSLSHRSLVPVLSKKT